MLDVTIEKIVPRGLGLAFAENLTVLVPLAAPGDEFRVSIREIKKRTAFADIVSVTRSGPRRVLPECELYGKCGGCDMQHMDYRAQLDAKKGFVRDCLQRIGKIEFDGEIEMISSPQPFDYRSACTLAHRPTKANARLLCTRNARRDRTFALPDTYAGLAIVARISPGKHELGHYLER